MTPSTKGCSKFINVEIHGADKEFTLSTLVYFGIMIFNLYMDKNFSDVGV